jgi:hypothetical protein
MQIRARIADMFGSLLSFLSAPSATASSTRASTSSSTSFFKVVSSAAAPTSAPRPSPIPPRRLLLASATCFAMPSACTSPSFDDLPLMKSVFLCSPRPHALSPATPSSTSSRSTARTSTASTSARFVTAPPSFFYFNLHFVELKSHSAQPPRYNRFSTLAPSTTAARLSSTR